MTSMSIYTISSNQVGVSGINLFSTGFAESCVRNLNKISQSQATIGQFETPSLSLTYSNLFQ